MEDLLGVNYIFLMYDDLLEVEVLSHVNEVLYVSFSVGRMNMGCIF